MKTFLKAIVQSFYDASFYRELARKGRGFGLGFIILAAFLSLIPMARLENADAFFDNKKEIFASLPTLTISSGELSVDAPTPLTYELLKAEQGGPLRIVIDPAADTDNTEALKSRMASEHIFLLVAKRHLALYDLSKGELNLTSLAQSEDRTFGAQDWHNLNEMTDLFFGGGFMALLLGFGFFFHLGSAALGGALLKVLSPHVATQLDFKACMRIAAVAKVPVGIVALLVTPYPPLQALLWFGFAAFGLLALRAKAVGNGPEIS